MMIRPIYLSNVKEPVFLHFLYSSGVTAAKAQQEPHLPWFLTAGMQLALRRSTYRIHLLS